MATDPNYLQGYSCFQGLTKHQLDAIAQIANAVCYPPGYVLSRENQPGRRLFFLMKGDVEVLYGIGEAGQARVDIVSGEEIVGCAALVEPYIYTATASSLTEIEVLEIDAEALRSMMREDCSLGFAIQQKVISVLIDRITSLRLER